MPGQCLKVNESASNAGTVPQIPPGNCLKFQESASNAGTILQIPPVNCLKLEETASNAWTVPKSPPGKCLKCCDCVYGRRTVSQVMDQYLKSHDITSNAGRVPKIREECLKCRERRLSQMPVKFFKLPDCTTRERTVSQMPAQ